jgi:hypothetical protein
MDIEFSFSLEPKAEPEVFHKRLSEDELVEYMAPGFYHPERDRIISGLQEKTSLTEIGELFNIQAGLHQTLLAHRKRAVQKLNLRLITSSCLSQHPFLRNSFSDNYTEINSPREMDRVRANDILLGALAFSTPTQPVSLVVEDLQNAYPVHTVLLLRKKEGVDPRVIKLMYWLLSYREYRKIYPSVPAPVLNVIQAHRLKKMPVPYTDNSDILNQVTRYIDELIEMDTRQQAINKKLAKLF